MFFSCTEQNQDLELTILNEHFQVFCPNMNCNDKEFLSNIIVANLVKPDSAHLPINRIRFKIKNSNNKTLLLMPMFYFDNSFGRDYYPYKYPQLLGGIKYSNLEFRDDSNNIIEHIPYSGHYKKPDLYKLSDSLIIDYNYKMGYKYTDKEESIKDGNFQLNSLIIPANSTVFYESYFTLPFNQNSSEVIELNKNKEYKVYLNFLSNKKEVMKHLSYSQKETVRENNYIIYDGELKSSNGVPIIFKDSKATQN